MGNLTYVIKLFLFLESILTRTIAYDLQGYATWPRLLGRGQRFKNCKNPQGLKLYLPLFQKCHRQNQCLVPQRSWISIQLQKNISDFFSFTAI